MGEGAGGSADGYPVSEAVATLKMMTLPTAKSTFVVT